jgi:hypothetical protein
MQEHAERPGLGAGDMSGLTPEGRPDPEWEADGIPADVHDVPADMHDGPDVYDVPADTHDGPDVYDVPADVYDGSEGMQDGLADAQDVPAGVLGGPAEGQDVPAAWAGEERPATGEPRVDAALARLDELASRPVTEHRAVFEDVHRRLRDVLGELDAREQNPDESAAAGAERRVAR